MLHRNLGIGSWIARRAERTPDRVALRFEGTERTYRALDERIVRLARALEDHGATRIGYRGDNHPAALETLFACGLLGLPYVALHPGQDNADLVLDASAVEALVAGGRYEPLDQPIGLDDVCVIASSSGTTGPSKGIPLTHGNLLFNALNLLVSLDLLRDDVILTSAPLYRMGGLGFTLPVLLKGGTSIVQAHADPERSLDLIEAHRVTVLFDAVHALEAMAATPSFRTRDLSSVRVCVTGGSLVPPRLVAAFRERGLCLQPGYGLTEAAPVALIMEPDEIAGHPGADGRPPMFCAVKVVDGELWVSGPNVTPTAEGWLRTGDAAEMDASGVVTVLGRVSDALVVDGRRVHPGPLEDVLRDHVGDCALVQATPEAPPVLFIGSVPRNHNGKILRHELKARLG